jgi:hypothetical protein
VVGCTYPGAVSAKAGQGGARERAEDLVAIHSHPSCSTDPAGNPTNEHHQERGHEAGGEKGSLGWRRRRALGAGGVDGDEDGEGQPARPPHQQRRRWPAAGEVGRRLLPRAHSLAPEFNSPAPDLINLI